MPSYILINFLWHFSNELSMYFYFTPVLISSCAFWVLFLILHLLQHLQYWSKSNILFCLNCSLLWSYLLTSALFASLLCFRSSITVSSSFLFTLYLSFSSLNSRFQSQFSLRLRFQSVYILSQSLYTLLNHTFPSWLIFLICHLHTIGALIKLFIFEMLLLFQILHSNTLNLQNLLVHFLEHKAIACSSFHHYSLQLFNNCLKFFTRISLIIPDTIISIIHFFFNCPNISFYCLCFQFHILLPTKFTLGFNSSSDNQLFFLIALAWLHTCCSVDSNISLSLPSLSIFLLHILIGFPSSSNGLLL